MSLVLLVNQEEWTARSVESVLEPAGYAVVKAYTGRQAVELAARLNDLVKPNMLGFREVTMKELASRSAEMWKRIARG